MKNVHPLKRKSIKPSSSTVRGMLPSNQFKVLDASMQSLRAAGLRFEWVWNGKDTGWVSTGYYEERVLCEIVASVEPMYAKISLNSAEVNLLTEAETFPPSYKKILEYPIHTKEEIQTYEFGIESTPERDLLSNIVECLSLIHI